MKRLILSVLLLVFASNLFSQETRVFKGKIGDSVVFMELVITEDSGVGMIMGRYFFETSLYDILLEGNRVADTYTIFCHYRIGDSILFDEVFNVGGVDTLKGTWFNNSKRVLKVELFPVDLSEIHNSNDVFTSVAKLKKTDLYGYIRSSFITVPSVSYKNITKGDKTLELLKEPFSECDFLRLVNGFPASQKDLINKKLNEIYLNYTLERFTCANHFDYDHDFNYETNISFLNNNLLGLVVSGSYYCGGAHPWIFDDVVLLDLNNGANYMLDDILAFDKSVVKYSDSTSSQFFEYRNKFFGPKLYDLIKTTKDFKTFAKMYKGTCDYNNADVWEYPNWIYTDKGIEFVPDFPWAMRSCAERVLVPFSKLEKYKNANFPYKFGK